MKVINYHWKKRKKNVLSSPNQQICDLSKWSRFKKRLPIAEPTYVWSWKQRWVSLECKKNSCLHRTLRKGLSNKSLFSLIISTELPLSSPSQIQILLKVQNQLCFLDICVPLSINKSPPVSPRFNTFILTVTTNFIQKFSTHFHWDSHV